LSGNGLQCERDTNVFDASQPPLWSTFDQSEPKIIFYFKIEFPLVLYFVTLAFTNQKPCTFQTNVDARFSYGPIHQTVPHFVQNA